MGHFFEIAFLMDYTYSGLLIIKVRFFGGVDLSLSSLRPLCVCVYVCFICPSILTFNLIVIFAFSLQNMANKGLFWGYFFKIEFLMDLHLFRPF